MSDPLPTRSAFGGTDGYAGQADALAVQYESVTFEEVHREVLHLVPAAPCRTIDIGAGTGRDAAALARRGHRVTAVEPTAELRRHGERLHAEAGIRWIDDGLPGLARVRALAESFDLALLTAVWMHLDAGERRLAMQNLAEIVASGSLILMSLRRGPVPEGRRMFDVSVEETEALAGSSGLSVVHRSDREDMLGRADVGWTALALKAG